ncbi:hypothetical protein PHYSODRAFT_301288 [Phytophthora sojae]|uniref:Uncharacterized protein n=1 Tax=Phytophthora sojae (strain P6497) TaxID=1094619 RepID=G4ZIC9_PHYSP|nr:hypothetical protein PHYSODRAFT_301288 [Phytophthora sojae]EGZ18765.1 hypothetical protein PHYSODRAFT_301288 [Phytophthora sojae]|eukprot:XP_009527823.1 hypothetical protein PHYSODRAFT_301288 [Phytophthora sojae]
MNISDLLDSCQAASNPQPDAAIPGPHLADAATTLAAASIQTGSKSQVAASRQQKTRSSRVRPQRKPTTGSKRKLKTYLNATQKADREAHAAFESRVFNLTLDINEQLIRLLEERRDLHATQLMVARQHFENGIYRVMERYMRVFGALSRRRTCNELTEFLAHVDPCMLGPDMNAKGGLPFFVWQWGCYNNRFHHWQFKDISTRIVTFIEDDDVEVDSELNTTSSIGPGPGGCVVETVGEFTGSPTRAMVAAMLPNLLSDGGFTALLTLQTMHFPARIFVYFDARGNIVKHVLEADAFAALHAIVEANPGRDTSSAPNERFAELPVVSTAALEPTSDETGVSSGAFTDGGSQASSTGKRYDVDYILN